MSELVSYLNKWWESLSPPQRAPSTEQPCAMTYEEVMQCAPRRRLYTGDLDDASSSGDEGDDDDDAPTEESGGASSSRFAESDGGDDAAVGSPSPSSLGDGVEESKESAAHDDLPLPRRLPEETKRPESVDVDLDDDDNHQR